MSLITRFVRAGLPRASPLNYSAIALLGITCSVRFQNQKPHVGQEGLQGVGRLFKNVV